MALGKKSSNLQLSNGYSKQNNGFFVHKTIRDLAIGGDLEFDKEILGDDQGKDTAA